MKIITFIIITLVSLLSIAAGFAKIMQVPQEIEFLTGFGLSVSVILIYGVVQVLGGVLLAVPKVRLVGAMLTIIAFLLSSILIILNGKTSFGFISLIPVVFTGWIIYHNLNSSRNQKKLETST